MVWGGGGGKTEKEERNEGSAYDKGLLTVY